MTDIVARYDWLCYLVLTPILTTLAGLLAFSIGGARTFESARALPLLLLAIWSPSIVAIGIAAATGRLRALVHPLLDAGTPEAWVVALLPLAIATSLAMSGSEPPTQTVPWLTLVAMNLIMGPLGEELGWRGFLLPRLVPSLGWVGAALAIGVVWALWHLPLWFVPSPHAAMSFPVFFATVVCFSVILTAVWHAGGGALGPVIAFHLTANVAVGALEISGVSSGDEFYRAALPVYGVAALTAAAWLASTTREACVLPAR